MNRYVRLAGLYLTGLCAVLGVQGQQKQVVLDRGGSTIVLEPYAPNIVRVTLSLQRDKATAAPGYGFIASPAAAGWTQSRNSDGDSFRSSRMVVEVGINHG